MHGAFTTPAILEYSSTSTTRDRAAKELLTAAGESGPGLVMAATIGEQLRLAREKLGIPLREISDQTRISVRYLEAIESNDYKRLPGGIFNRSFVKAYARCVGYDEKEAVEAYARYVREQGVPGDEVITTPHHAKVYTDTPATRSPILTLVLAIVILTILTLGALAALHWVQRRSAVLNHNQHLTLIAAVEDPAEQPSRFSAGMVFSHDLF